MMGMADKGSGEYGNGQERWRICGATGISATETREGGEGISSDTVSQQNICETAEMACFGQSRWIRCIMARITEVETREKQGARMRETSSSVDTW